MTWRILGSISCILWLRVYMCTCIVSALIAHSHWLLIIDSMLDHAQMIEIYDVKKVRLKYW